jgi:carbon-monoxide dehydrogenase small subunit
MASARVTSGRATPVGGRLTIRIAFELNGQPIEAEVPAARPAIDVLREDLGLTGTKEGCSIGVCGLCSILVDGQLLSACLMPAAFLDGSAVQTIEGLAEADGRLSTMQRSFIRRGGLQCGICTPGQIVAATALLAENPDPTRDEIRAWMMGNLCRCTGYEQIVEAIEDAAK